MVLVPMSQIPPPLWRQMLLKNAGVSQAAVARKAGVPESTVSRVIANTYWSATPKGQEKRDQVRRAVAQLLKVKVEDVFPADEPAAAPPERAPAKKKARRG